MRYCILLNEQCFKIIVLKPEDGDWMETDGGVCLISGAIFS